MSFLLLLGLAVALAGSSVVPFELPPEEPVPAWSGPLDLADFERRAVQDEVGVVVIAEDGRWKLTVRDADGTVRVAWVEPPVTPEAREQLVWLADSLVRPVTGLSLRIGPREVSPAQVATEEVAQAVAPPRGRVPAAEVPEVSTAAVQAAEEAGPHDLVEPSPAAPPRETRVLPPPPLEEIEPVVPPGERSVAPAISPTVAIGAALRSGVAPAATGRLGLEVGAPRWTAGGEVQVELPSALHRGADSSLRAWGLDVSAGPVSGPFRAELVAGVALATFREEGAAPQRIAMPRVAARVGADVAVERVVLRPRFGVERELVPVRLVVDGRDFGRMSPWTVSGELALALPPRRRSE